MQCGAGARPDWAGKRLVAVKKMKKKWEGGWDECQKLKEIEVRHIASVFCAQANLFLVFASHSLPSKHYSSLRFLPPACYQGALLRF